MAATRFSRSLMTSSVRPASRMRFQSCSRSSYDIVRSEMPARAASRVSASVGRERGRAVDPIVCSVGFSDSEPSSTDRAPAVGAESCGCRASRRTSSSTIRIESRVAWRSWSIALRRTCIFSRASRSMDGVSFHHIDFVRIRKTAKPISNATTASWVFELMQRLRGRGWTEPDPFDERTEDSSRDAGSAGSGSVGSPRDRPSFALRLAGFVAQGSCPALLGSSAAIQPRQSGALRYDDCYLVAGKSVDRAA